jgi:hypothetical protein
MNKSKLPVAKKRSMKQSKLPVAKKTKVATNSGGKKTFTVAGVLLSFKEKTEYGSAKDTFRIQGYIPNTRMWWQKG